MIKSNRIYIFSVLYIIIVVISIKKSYYTAKEERKGRERVNTEYKRI